MKVIKNKINRYYPYLFFVLAAIFILSIQLFHHVTVVGFDSYFHMSRAYETANQITSGHFSYFMSLFSWFGTGRIVNALYGPIGGYFMGIILLITRSWYHWELAMDFIVLISCGSTMYILGKYWKDNTIINILISIIYMVSYPPMVFVSNTEFTGVGAIFIPLVVLLGSKILVERHIPVLQLILLITIIAEIHSMTLLISVLFLLPFVVNGFIRSKEKTQYMLDLLEAMVCVLFLTVNVWGSVIEVMMSNHNHIIPTFSAVTNMNSNWYNTISLVHGKISVIGGAIALICIICIVAWLLTFSSGNTVVNTLMSTGTIFMWMSSQWFPWKYIQRAFPMIDIIQFPKRFVVLGLVPMLVALGAFTSPLFELHHPTCKILVLVFLCLLGFESWNYDYMSYKSRINAFYSSNVIIWSTTKRANYRSASQLRDTLFANNPKKFLRTVSKPVPDYLPTGIRYKPQNYSQMLYWVHDYRQLVEPFVRSHNYQKTLVNHATEHIKINADRNGYHRVPFVVYKHSHIMLNGQHIHPKPSRVGAMRIYLHNGENELSIKYCPSYWFDIGIIISLIMWIIFIFNIKWKYESRQIQKHSDKA